MLGHALREAGLRQDASEQTGLGVGEIVGRRPAVVHDRRVDLAQLGIGADAGELRGPVAAWHAAEGFVVVPEEAEILHPGTITEQPTYFFRGVFAAGASRNASDMPISTPLTSAE